MGTEVSERGENRTSVPVFLVILYLCLAPVPAHADRLGEGLAQMSFGMGGALTIGVIGVPACVISGAIVKRAVNDEHLSWQWQAAGWIFGVLNGVAGALYLASDIDGVPVIVGISNITIGAMTIGVTIWGSCIPEEKGIAISPMILPPPTSVEVGEPAFGLVLSGRF